MEGSQFIFHLDSLIKDKMVEKSNYGYNLTKRGKEFANRMDYGDTDIKVQAKISAVMCCIREEKGMTQYLLYTRKKNPFWGYQGFPTGKVKKGEDIANAAIRELLEETGLEGIPELFAIRHYRVSSEKDILLEDKIFFAFRFINPKGNLVSGKEGDFQWINKDDVNKYLERPVKEVPEIIEALENFSGEITFSEGSYKSDDF